MHREQDNHLKDTKRLYKQAHLNSVQRVCISQNPHDCIKSLKLGDPCMGSGHILCYLFDVLVQIYEDYGYNSREAVASIIKNNLWGLDFDERAAQLAYFAVMMKARQYDRRIFSRNIQPHVYVIEESNGIDKNCLEYFCDGRAELTEAMQTIVEELHDAKEYGSLLTVEEQDWEMLYARFDEIEQGISIYQIAVLEQIKPLVQVAQALAQKYDVVVTNARSVYGQTRKNAVLLRVFGHENTGLLLGQLDSALGRKLLGASIMKKRESYE